MFVSFQVENIHRLQVIDILIAEFIQSDSNQVTFYCYTTTNINGILQCNKSKKGKVLDRKGMEWKEEEEDRNLRNVVSYV